MRAFSLRSINPLRAILFLVLGFSLFYALAFVRLYRQPHPYTAASEWMFENIAPGSKLLGPHWDDRLPVSLPGKFAPHTFVMEGPGTDLLLYERDTPAKLDQLVQGAATGDYLVFPTPRLQGSVPRIPEEYPYTTAFFQLLWAEKLGFKLVKTFKNRPSLFGIEFNNDLADESFSVYDHPKVTIFRNVERLTPEQLKSRILSKAQFDGLPTLDEILLTDTGGGSSAGSYSSGWSHALLTIVFVEILAFSFLILASGAFLLSPDAGLGVSKVLGLFAAALFTWILPSLGIGTVTRPLCVMVAVAFAVTAFVRWRREPALRARVKAAWSAHGRSVEAVFLGTTFLFLLIRSLTPEIFFGEKPMDFSFLNFFIRNGSIPPQDPWAAGSTMRYYYFGSYVFGWLFKTLGVPGAIGYNIAVALVGAFIAASIYSLIATFSNRARGVAIASFSVVFVANLEVLRLLIWEWRGIGFDSTFWPSTRHLTPHLFSEYTSWSLLFGDLHAHVIALPLGCAFLFLVRALVTALAENHSKAGIQIGFMIGALLAVMLATNSWDVVTYGAVAGLIVLSSIAVLYGASKIQASLTSWRFVPALAALFISLAVVALPYHFGSSGYAAVNVDWIRPTPGEPWHVTLSQLFFHWGQWWIIIVAGAGLSASLMREPIRRPQLVLLPLVFVPAVLVVLAAIEGIPDLPWQAPLVATLLIGSSVLIRFPRSEALSESYVRSLLVAAGLILSVSEAFIVSDRMNTVFKMYNAIWLFLGIAAAILALRAIDAFFAVRARGKLGSAQSVLAGIAVLSLLAAGLAGVSNVYAIAAMRRVPPVTGTLNGQAFLALSNPADAGVIRWLNRQVSGQPVIVEAIGNPYGPSARIVMHTGLPTVLGWDHHTSQRGLPPRYVEERKLAVTTIYTAEQGRVAYELLAQYGVDFVIVSSLERRSYPPGGLEKFDNHPDLFAKVYDVDGGTVYATAFSKWFPRG